MNINLTKDDAKMLKDILINDVNFSEIDKNVEYKDNLITRLICKINNKLTKEQK